MQIWFTEDKIEMSIGNISRFSGTKLRHRGSYGTDLPEGVKAACKLTYRVAHKNRNGILSTIIYVDAITSISVWGNFS